MAHVTDQLNTALADRYRIERELGQGGMALVYLATDLKHDRKVALKVLRPELAAVIGAERFLQEIKVTANLQHPHILPLHDSGEAGSFLYYVMPYVEGDTLRDKLAREKQLDIAEAVEITRGVASALDYAHRQGVIHRDIKPENVLLHDGQALVADFGIALAVSQAGGNRLTETGLSIGTPHYMSPEQAMGDRELDARSDVYSLGAMLYEMLAGDPPYLGSTAQAIVAKVITEKAPPVTQHRETVPAHVAAAIQKALAKMPADRFRSAADFAAALADTSFALAPTAAGAATTGRAGPSAGRSPITIGLVAALAAVTGVAVWGWLRPSPPAQLARFTIAMPDDAPIRLGGGGSSLAIAPDGSRFVYVGADRQLYVRLLDQLESQPLPAHPNHTPFFSPDGEWVGFFEGGAIKKVALAGGPPLTVTDAPNLRGASWGEDGMIVFTPTPTAPLVRVPAGGGAVDTITRLARDRGETSHRWPEVLPGGRAVVFTAYSGDLSSAQLATVSLETGEVRYHTAGMSPVYVEPGYLVYAGANGALLAISFDADRLEVTGSPVSLVEGILVKTQVLGEFAVSRNGTLLYLSGEGTRVGIHLVDTLGSSEALLDDLDGGFAPRFSPDGRRLAVRASAEGAAEIWTYDLERRTLSRLSFGAGADYPEWSPGGDTIYYSASSERGRNIWRRAADGSGEAELVLDRPSDQWEIAIAPGGARALIREIAPETQLDLLVLPLQPVGEARPWVVTPFVERSPAIAPDGRWAAYVSNESGQDEVYVRAFPEASGRWQVSAAGGVEPLWSQDGRTIYYRNSDSLLAVSVETTPTFAVGPRRLLFLSAFQDNINHTNYDRDARGRFVMLGQRESARSALVIVLNWLDELEARMGG